MQGSKIIVSTDPKGVFQEVIISGTPKPGVWMELTSAALVDLVPTMQVYTPGSDGKARALCILLDDPNQGKLYDDAYVSGTRGMVYFPQAGERLNIRVADVAGTADDHTVSGRMIGQSGTGKFINTTGTPDSEPFQLLEAATDPTSEALMLAMVTGC